MSQERAVQQRPALGISRRAVLIGGVSALALVATDALAMPWSARAATQTDFDRFRTQWLTTLVGNYDLSDSVIQKYVVDSAAAASVFWHGSTPLNTASGRTYLWSDLDSGSTSAIQTSAMGRLRQLALAWKSPGSALSGDPELKADLLSALDWFLANKYDASAYYDNWWDWQIGVPLALNDFCVLMHDDLTADQLSTAMAAIKHYEPDPRITGGATSTSANRNWACAVTMLRGALSSDQATMDKARSDLETIFPYSTAQDGIYPDGGFIQHAYYSYTGGYGVSMIQYLSYLMVASLDTPWAFSTAQVAEVYDWTQDNYRPWIYAGAFMDMTRGRNFSRFYDTDRRDGRLAMATLLQLAAVFPAASAATLRAQLKGWITAYNTYSYAGNTPGERQASFFTYDPVPLEQVRISSIVLGRQLMNDSGTPVGAESTTTVVATSMARVVHRRPGFAMGFAMETVAIRPYESANGENLMGWYEGEGAVYLYLPNQLGHWSNEYWPTANKLRIPGTTVITKTPTLGAAIRSTVTNTWAGAALLDGNAAVGMGLAFKTQPLTARKSWFCIGDVIVCLGAGITNTDGNAIETIIEQRNVGPNGQTVPIVDGAPFSAVSSTPTTFTPKWAFIPNTSGYLFPVHGTTIQAIREDRTGQWTDMDSRGTHEDYTVYSRRFITMWFEHGINPTNDSYAYIQLPGASQAETEAASADAAGVTIVVNSADVQAVTRIGNGDGASATLTADAVAGGYITMANFWTATNPPKAAGIQVDKRASVVLSRQGNELSIAVSDPTQRVTGDITVTVDGAVARRDAQDPGDPEVTVIATAPNLQITVPVSGAAGRSFVARFTVAETAAAPVTVRYVDGDGRVVAPEATLRGDVGDVYTAEPARPDGYRLVTTPANARGTFTGAAITVTFVYASTATATSAAAPVSPGRTDSGQHGGLADTGSSVPTGVIAATVGAIAAGAAALGLRRDRPTRRGGADDSAHTEAQ